MGKVILGLIGEHEDVSKVTKIFVSHGFYRTTIYSKVKEIAKYLLPGNIFPDETLSEIRDRGYKVSGLYWINLVLASVPEKKDLIVIDDIDEKDVIDGIMSVYYVGGNKPSDMPSNNFISVNDEMDEKLSKIIKDISRNK